MIFLDRRAGDFSDPQRLLSGIHDEMQLIKRNRLGLTFIGALCLLGMMPGGLARVARGDRCSTTCVLSNLGQPLSDARLPRQDGRLVAGSVTLESIELLPPLRPYTAAALTIQLYAERLAITMHYDLRSLTPTQAQDIFDRLLERLHGSAAGGTP
jgi:hypothetical protein